MPPVLDPLEDVVELDVAVLVAGDVVRRVDQVGGLDGLLAEAQVGDRDAAGLLGVVGEIGLRVHVGVVADDLDRTLVGADRAVGAQAPELALHGAGGGDIQAGTHCKRGVGDVVDDADREVVLGGGGLHVVVDGLDHGGVELLGAQPVAAAEDLRRLAALHEGRAHIHVKRVPKGSRLLGAIEHREGLGRGRNRREQVLGREGPVHPHFHQAHLLTLAGEVVDHLFDGLAAASHGDDDPVGLRVADVVKRLVAPAGEIADLLHGGNDDPRDLEIKGVGGLAALEVDVRVLGRATQLGPLGVGAPRPELRHGLEVDELRHVLDVDEGDLLDLVRGAEPVEEVHEGQARLDGGQMRHQAEVHDLLDRGRGEHGNPRLPHRHHVLVVAEDRQRVRRNGAGRHLKHPRQELARDLVHVGDHEQQALGGREGRGQRARGERAVHGGRRTGFGLKLAHGHGLPEHVLAAGGRPLVGDLGDGGRGGDGVDRRHVAHGIGHVGRSGVAIHGFHLLLGHNCLLAKGIVFKVDLNCCRKRVRGVKGSRGRVKDGCLFSLEPSNP